MKAKINWLITPPTIPVYVQVRGYDMIWTMRVNGDDIVFVADEAPELKPGMRFAIFNGPDKIGEVET